jgi:hypothetical protein
MASDRYARKQLIEVRPQQPLACVLAAPAWRLCGEVNYLVRIQVENNLVSS